MIAQGETEILKLYRLHKQITESATLLDDEESAEAAFLKASGIADRMYALPSTCAADMAAKMIVAHCYGSYSGLEENDPVWKEARELVEALTN